MKLIADSGSTKTTWLIHDGNSVTATISTAGLNPYFHNTGSIETVLQEGLAPALKEVNIREVHFYGAGCSTESNNRMVADAIDRILPGVPVTVLHDILGAARALFGDGAGIACILGTGCNSCFYNGNTTVSPIDSLGYLFGDEGAGSYLGKLFLGAYLRKELPADLRKAFDEQYGYTLENILHALYNQPAPNRYLASFSLFLSPFRSHPFVSGIIECSFRDFFSAHIRKYDGYKSLQTGFIGSIAYHYREFLEKVANEEGVVISRILSSPAEGLAEYHRNH